MKFKNLSLILIFLLLLSSCGAKRSALEKQQQKEYEEYLSSTETAQPEMLQVSKNALEYIGAPYKYGGTKKSGMDCSGLIYTAFLEEDIALPRTSRGMSLEGKRIDLEEVKIGDLLFFETNKNRKVINHVGLVIKATPNEISFIHSTTSLGVIISKLQQKYWRQAFVMARRIK